MENQVFFNRLVQKDMNEICRYYREEAGEKLADRFFEAALQVIEKAAGNPRHFHRLEEQPRLRRAPVEGFPYHFLYREISEDIRVLVLRHDSRHWNYGTRRN